MPCQLLVDHILRQICQTLSFGLIQEPNMSMLVGQLAETSKVPLGKRTGVIISNPLVANRG